MIKNFKAGLRAIVTIGALGFIATQGQAASSGCIISAPARLVCDQDGCVRPITEPECRTTLVAMTRTTARPRRVATMVRTDRDELSALLARLD